MDCGQPLEFAPPEPPHKDLSQTCLAVSHSENRNVESGKRIFHFILICRRQILEEMLRETKSKLLAVQREISTI